MIQSMSRHMTNANAMVAVERGPKQTRAVAMNQDLSCLRDPEDLGPLTLAEDGLRSACGRTYPISNGIPRFVGAENYCGDFGVQWNLFRETQLDSYAGVNCSETRLARCLRGNLPGLKDRKVLEAGSGAGRFTEILLKYGSVVHSFDYSNAVESNALNNGHHDNLVLVQADIQRMPFARESYDCVICLGVLQHTPDPEESIRCLWEMVAPGGTLVIDHYVWKWRNVLPPPIGGAEILYRQLILRLPRSARFKAVRALTDFWFPWHWRFKDSLFIQRALRRISPVHFYYPQQRLRDRQMYYEWALLDTHDGTTDFYKHHRAPGQIRTFLEQIGASDIAVELGGNGVEAFCRKRCR
jgi:SAM-dependent methyltransferase